MFHPLTALVLPFAICLPTAQAPLAIDVAAPAAATAPMGNSSYYWVGDVSGLNTIDYTTNFYLTDFDRYDFEFTACGNGSNTLTVKIQVQLNNGLWSNKIVRNLTPGQTKVGDFEVTNQTAGNELYRVRMSRKLGTKKIDYTVKLTRK